MVINNNLEVRCRKAIIKISRSVEKIRQQLYRVDEINDKLSHIIKNLGEEYYYGRRLKDSYELSKDEQAMKY